LCGYSFRQGIRVQELDRKDKVVGEWSETSDVSFDSSCNRKETTIAAPPSNLKRISMTSQDLQDIRSIQPFVITSDNVNDHTFAYLGKEQLVDGDCYVFDVAPRNIEKGKRYFQGRLWIESTDLHVMRTNGKVVPDIRERNGFENLFPRLESYRRQVDGLHWFPASISGEDNLTFSAGTQKIREVITFENYVKHATP
jgi:hypothetical protein